MPTGNSQNILLISLQKDLDTIGLKSIHYHLLNNGYESYILNLPDFKTMDSVSFSNLRKFVIELDPSLLGISLMSIEYNDVCRLSAFLKSCLKSTPVVWGGIHPTISPETCLDYADFVCVGEGERVILDMAREVRNNGSIKKINNLVFLENGEIKRNPLYPLIENLDDLAYSDNKLENSYIMAGRNIVPLSREVFKRYDRYHGKFYSIMTSRGCPFSCTYCCNNFIINLYKTNRIRKRSTESIIGGLQEALRRSPEIEYINFQDDCFLACSEEYLRDFCGMYVKKIGKPFIIRTIPIYITAGKIKSLKEAGLAWISLGLQSGSDRTCQQIYKRKSLKSDFLRAAKIINDFEVAPFYDVILDNPLETEEDVLETVDTFMKTPKPFYVQLLSLVFYRGTELYEIARSDYPEHVDDYLSKDYLIPKDDVYNVLIRLAAFIPSGQMAGILDLYKRDRKGIRFGMALNYANLLSILIFEPLAYFRVIRLSQGKSCLKTILVLPLYFKEGILRYLNQFRGRFQISRQRVNYG